MKTKDTKQASPQSPLMVEDETAERAKKLLRDAGLIVNAGVGKTPKPTSKNKDEKR